MIENLYVSILGLVCNFSLHLLSQKIGPVVEIEHPSHLGMGNTNYAESDLQRIDLNDAPYENIISFE